MSLSMIIPQMEVLTWHFYQAWETLGTSGERVFREYEYEYPLEQLPLKPQFFFFQTIGGLSSA